LNIDDEALKLYLQFSVVKHIVFKLGRIIRNIKWVEVGLMFNSNLAKRNCTKLTALHSRTHTLDSKHFV